MVNFIRVCKFIIVKKIFLKQSKSLQFYISDGNGGLSDNEIFTISKYSPGTKYVKVPLDLEHVFILPEDRCSKFIDLHYDGMWLFYGTSVFKEKSPFFLPL